MDVYLYSEEDELIRGRRCAGARVREGGMGEGSEVIKEEEGKDEEESKVREKRAQEISGRKG